MNLYYQTKAHNKVLFVNSFSPYQKRALDAYCKKSGKAIEPLLIVNSKKFIADWIKELGCKIITVDFNDTSSIQKHLAPYANDILTATCLGDGNVPKLKAVVPFLPNCTLPTEASLEWTTQKIKMRNLLRSYDKDISPKYAVATDASQTTIDKLEKQVGYPMVVKPSGLAASLLVSICYHREELEAVLNKTIKKIDAIYKLKNGRGTPEILVEEFMEGSMYSIDAYVNARGVIYFTPLVYVKTGREVGFDDFFGYMRMTPTQLNPKHLEHAQDAAVKSIKALGMRSTTCHIELLRTENGWKVIELGPRQGGFRHQMYELSYGIDHSLNDILIRLPHKPNIPRKVKGYTAVLQFYAKNEGTLKKIIGFERVEALTSLKSIKMRKTPGDICMFAKHGGDPVFDVILFDPVRSNVLADIRRIEQHLDIVTE